jgi:tRNA U34 2-thiouridine synthase MnmA/TrmU
MSSSKRKAVVLISGGLDSMLAAKLMLEQGIHVEGINFFTGFCHSGHTSAIRNKKKAKPPRNDALWVAEQLGIKLHIVDIVEEYKDILINPKHGYGQNLNPCLDCKIFMVQKAFEWMAENDFDFIVTGEVVGQRPKSQRRETMPIVEKQSGADDLLLRPLCAKQLAETKPEREGWVDRTQLLDFHGRNRKPQLALAERFHFDDYAQPAGGCCVLTDSNYSRRLEDMWAHRVSKDYSMDDIILLKAGRHIRPRSHFKMIVGRDMGENNFLQGYRNQFVSMRAKFHKGPLVLLEGECASDDLTLAAQILSRFCDGKDESQVTIEIQQTDGAIAEQVVTPLAAEQINKEWYV